MTGDMPAPAFPQLCFTLCAAYGAWGVSLSSATTAWRATDLDPPKSALVGLMGAALGLERPHLGDLAAAVTVAVRTGSRPTRESRPDYHTVSRARKPRDRTRWSRFEELRPALSGLEHPGALLSRREYWSTGLWTVAVAAAPDLLARLDGALQQPRWVLYAGRKACTLALPPDPQTVVAPGPFVALEAYGWPWTRHPGLEMLTAERHGLPPLTAPFGADELLLADADYPGLPADGLRRTVRRRDLPDPLPLAGGRIYQRFQERVEVQLPPPASSGAQP